LYEKAIEFKVPSAYYNLATFYDETNGDLIDIDEKNIKKAIELYEKAAELEDTYAYHALG
jgi:TPR repeat protein